VCPAILSAWSSHALPRPQFLGRKQCSFKRDLCAGKGPAVAPSHWALSYTLPPKTCGDHRSFKEGRVAQGSAEWEEATAWPFLAHKTIS
jgi:hypothetical protein